MVIFEDALAVLLQAFFDQMLGNFKARLVLLKTWLSVHNAEAACAMVTVELAEVGSCREYDLPLNGSSSRGSRFIKITIDTLAASFMLAAKISGFDLNLIGETSSRSDVLRVIFLYEI